MNGCIKFRDPGVSLSFAKKRIDKTDLPDLRLEAFTLEEIDQAYEYSRACVVEDDRRAHVDATKLLFLIERGDYEAALQHARWLVDNGIKLREHVLKDARTMIDQKKA